VRSAIKLEQVNWALRAGESPSVHSLGTDSSGSVGTNLAPVADAATATTAVFSNEDRQRRLTSLLHHLTVDGDAPDHELPTATALPVLWVGEPRQMRRVDSASTGWRFAWLFVLAGVTGAFVGWGTILDLPHLVRYSLPQEKTEIPVAANVQSTTEVPPPVHASLSQEKNKPPIAANVQSTTGVAPLVHESLSRENTEPSIATNVQSTTGVPLPVHDSLSRENTEPSIATNVRSTTETPSPIHDSLREKNTETPVAAHVESTTEAPALMHDSLPQESNSLPQDNKPALRTMETSSVQTRKHQLSESVDGPLVPDTDEIAAFVKRGKDFAANGDLISARLLLQRAAEAADSAEAALALGETFDPLVFQRLGVIGIKPDAASARKWYQRAAKLGSPLALQYLAKLDGAP